MAPRNNDADTSYSNKNCTDEMDCDTEDPLPCLMHKKHKVVKLIKSQIKKLQEDCALNCPQLTDVYYLEDGSTERTNCLSQQSSKSRRQTRSADRSMERPVEGGSGYPRRSTTSSRNVAFWCYFLAFLLATILLIFLMVWISAGPLSNFLVHTPIPHTAFVRTDSICSLEKKYLLRWSKPEYFE